VSPSHVVIEAPVEMRQRIIEPVIMIWRAARMLFRKPAAALLLCRMAAWVFAVTIMLRFMPIPRVMEIVRPSIKDPVDSGNTEFIQERLGQLIDMLLGQKFLSLTTTCWKRAIVLHRFLGLEGIDTQVLFGVRKDVDGRLMGHAWLARDGEPILEVSPPEYTVTYSFP
jgi:Transglutaminase-like superfamily